MCHFYRLIVLLCFFSTQFADGAIFFYYDKLEPLEHQDSQTIEWQIFEKDNLVFFEGYCDTLPKTPYYLNIEVSGCKGVDAERFYQALRSQLGIKDDAVKNDRRARLIIKDGAPDAAAPFVQQQRIFEGVKELREKYLVGAEEIACLDDKNNTLSDLSLNCVSLLHAFKAVAASEHKTQLGHEIREGILVSSLALRPTDNPEDGWQVRGLMINEFVHHFCAVKLLTKEAFRLKCIVDAQGEFRNLSFTYDSASYNCDLNQSRCDRQGDIKEIGEMFFPKTFLLLECGGLSTVEPDKPWRNDVFVPVQNETKVYTSISLSTRRHATRPQKPLNRGGEVLLRWDSNLTYDADGFHITEEWGSIFNLNTLLN